MRKFSFTLGTSERRYFDDPQPQYPLDSLSRLVEIAEYEKADTYSLIVEPDPTPLEKLLVLVNKMNHKTFVNVVDPALLVECDQQLKELLK